MKQLSLLRKSTLVCGIIATMALMSSCGSNSGALAPEKAASRLSGSPITMVFSHNDTNSPNWRDVYEAGPLPERAERALITWLHNSTVREFSYVYPQYYVSTTNSKGGGEVVWALCTDGQGNLLGVLIPGSKRTPAWDLPTIGGYKVFVCNTPEKDALSAAIMESMADAGYDKVRIDTRKAQGVVDKQYLISKPLNDAEQKEMERARKAHEAAVAAAKKKAKDSAKATFGKPVSTSTTKEDDDTDSVSTSSTTSSDDDDDDVSISSSSSDDDDDSTTSSDDDDSSSDDTDLDSDSSSDDDDDE